jgi:type IV secretion system protein VirB5
MTRKELVLVIAGVLGAGALTPAHAAMAVIDVSAIRQLLQQVSTLREQLANAREQLRQSQQSYAAMTGTRGMERLAGGLTRNYLPPDWAALAEVLSETSTRYGALSRELVALEQANAVLGTSELAALTPQARARVEESRRAGALAQVLAREALATTGRRFTTVQSLLDAIGTAQDPKAVMDLSARIQAEQAMLANEQTKLTSLFQALEAERAVQSQQARERAVRDVGSLRRLPPLGL